MDANHFSLDETSLRVDGLADASGEIWVAAPAANPFDFFGDDSMGDYEDYDEDFGAENENYDDDFAYGDDWQDDSFFAPGGMDGPSVKTFTHGNQRLTLVFARESEDLYRVVIRLEVVVE